MFIGLGGTGGKVGTELERWLRRNLRGADGESPVGRETSKYLAYELPACFQFVYADLDEQEAHELRRQAAPPTGDYSRAVAKTSHLATNLVPVQRSYPEVAQSLRIAADQQVRHWLPPADGEPNIAPLARGAGQLPTIARAALFETMATTGGVEVVQRPIRQAIHALGSSGDELSALGGAGVNACDVFVVFSVAGGTGTGLYYDYLHLIADAFRESGIEILIHPLVVMPSAFPVGQGGGRPAMLNAGRGLLDLARLVDDQNTRAADKAFGTAAAKLDKGLSVAYPGPERKVIRIDASIIQTAYLFSETTGLSPADLHRSMVSFILAMAGVRERPGGGGAEGPGVSQNFFINRGVARQSLAASGVGSRSLSEAAVTSLSVPRGEILDILGAHLLSLAVSASDERGHAAEDNEPLLHEFMNASGLADLVRRPNYARSQVHQAEPGAARTRAMHNELRHLADILSERVPKMASDFDPWQGLRALLTNPIPGHQDPVDLLRAERAILGRGQTAGGWRPAGGSEPMTAERMLHRRAVFTATSDDPPEDADQRQQDEWFRRKVNAAWNQAWAGQRPEWERKLTRFKSVLRALTEALRRHHLAEGVALTQRVADLYAERKVAPYFLPDLPQNPEEFYRALAAKLATALGTGDDPVTMLGALLEPDFWEKAAADANGIGAERAMAIFRRRIDDAIWHRTRQGALIIPQLADLLAAASGLPSTVPEPEQERFSNKLEGFVPPGLLPSAAGDVKVLVTYPVGSAGRAGDGQAPDPARAPATPAADSGPGSPDDGGSPNGSGRPSGGASGPAGRIYVLPTRNSEVERRLGETLTSQLGRQPGAVDFEFSPTREESLTVVLIRTALGVTDVPEVRKVMTYWSTALRNQQQDDYLKWRQRLGYHYDWLLTTEEQRVNILQRLLIAMRNGQVSLVGGTVAKPAEIAFRISAGEGVDVARLQLRLTGFGPTSPWGSLLHAYEESTLGGDELNRQRMYHSLMNVSPVVTLADDEFSIVSAPLYQEFRKVAEREKNLLSWLYGELRKRGEGDASTRLRRVESLLKFWHDTVPAALVKEFAVSTDDGSSLAQLDHGWAGLTAADFGGGLGG